MSSYYNSMLTGHGRSIENCQDVYEQLRGHQIFVVRDCGYGMDGTCNKRIRYDGVGGISQVRQYFNQVIVHLGVDLTATVNCKASCVF